MLIVLIVLVFAQHLPEPHIKHPQVELFIESNENSFLSAETIAKK